jgi:hypothetical protein
MRRTPFSTQLGRYARLRRCLLLLSAFFSLFNMNKSFDFVLGPAILVWDLATLRIEPQLNAGETVLNLIALTIAFPEGQQHVLETMVFIASCLVEVP